jgi:hypothetical protein
MSKNKVFISLLVLLAFLFGYVVRGLTSINSFSHKWVFSSEPPSPSIKINGTDVRGQKHICIISRVWEGFYYDIEGVMDAV